MCADVPVNIDIIANWLKDIGFPCGRTELVRTARDKGAGKEVIFLLEQLPDKTLESQPHPQPDYPTANGYGTNLKKVYETKSALKEGLNMPAERPEPYRSLEDLPGAVRENLPPHAQEIFMKAHNNALQQYLNPKERRGGASESLEEVAHKVAWAAVKQEYEKSASGEWVKKNE